jgi:hypothetical protein
MRPGILESFLITGVGVVSGLALAAAGVKTIGTLAAARMPQLNGLHIDARVLVFSLVLAVVVASACGLAPILMT